MRKIVLFFVVVLAGCFSPANKSSKPIVLVTIPPYAYFVEQIAGNTVATEIFVPAGANPHTYEPTPKQVEKFAQTKLWFRLGDPIEKKILPFMRERQIKDINLSKGLLLLTGSHKCGDHAHEAKDLHVWLDPRLALKQAKKICEELSQALPEHKKMFEQNTLRLIERLVRLDQEILAELGPFEGSSLMVSHPALGYYCKRYGFQQLSIECEGKDPLPKQVAHVVEEAQEKDIKVIFIEPQYNNKGALLIAEKLDLPTYQIDPYALDYFNMMNDLSKSIVNYYGHQK
ncbi:MAG TPA: zinc ABC transporter substrate-binding protein [Rhabdochlamydiaceae bacterium]|nr:zinc ABC transporter substrate-binding protein [Rhabdochlamydiaceae bacterium]